MLAFFIRRILYAIIAMWAVSIISFVIINLPAGDFVTTYIATQLATGNLVSGGRSRDSARVLWAE